MSEVHKKPPGTVNTQQREVRAISSCALIIGGWSLNEYAADHIPGSANLLARKAEKPAVVGQWRCRLSTRFRLGAAAQAPRVSGGSGRKQSCVGVHDG